MKGIVKSKKKRVTFSCVYSREKKGLFSPKLAFVKQQSNFPSKNIYGKQMEILGIPQHYFFFFGVIRNAQIVRTLIHTKYLNSLLRNACIGMFLIIFSFFIRNHQLL